MNAADSSTTGTDPEALPFRRLEGGAWRYVLRPAATLDPASKAPLVIAIHGSDRDIAGLVQGFGMDGGATILAPLFPKEMDGADIADDYKFLPSGEPDYVALLDRMREQALEELGLTPSAVYLFGFSGGAQFAHRYGLFRAATLDGMVIAAPGNVTLMRDDIEWWPGLKGAQAATGYAPDLPALKRLPCAVIVGSDDNKPSSVSRAPGTRYGADHEGLAGSSRTDKARALSESLTAFGATPEFHELPGVGHQLAPCVTAAAQILRGWLAKKNNASPDQTSSRRNT